MMRKFVCASLLVGLGTTSVAEGQNLLVNPSFALNPSPQNPQDSITGWQPGIGCLGCSASHSTDDAIGEADSGSALISIGNPSANTGGDWVQFVDVTAGTSYTFGAKMKRSGNPAVSHEISMRVQWYTSQGGTLIPPEAVAIFSAAVPFDIWGDLGSQTAVAPAGATRAEVDFRVEKLDAAVSINGQIDRAYFGIGPLPVTLSAFDVE